MTARVTIVGGGLAGLRGRLAARPARGRRRPLRDAARAQHARPPDGRPRRARLLEQPARQRARPGRGPPQGGDAPAGLADRARGRRGEGARGQRAGGGPRPLRAPHHRGGRGPARGRAPPRGGPAHPRRPASPSWPPGPSPRRRWPRDIAAFVGAGPTSTSTTRSARWWRRRASTSTATFRASRYGKGGDDYVNCPLDETEYRAFYEALDGRGVRRASTTSRRSSSSRAACPSR